MTMNCLKVFIILWSCNIAFDASVTATVRGDINVYESKQKYCGELLERSIEIFCVDIPNRIKMLESQKHNRNTRDTVRKSQVRRLKHRYLISQCCVKECNLNFIKSNCPGTRKSNKKKNTGLVQKPISSQPNKTKTMTTAIPQNIMSRFSKKKNIPTTSRPTTTTTTTSRPTTTTTTTTTTSRPTTTTSTIRPITTTTTEYYYDDKYYFLLPSS